MAKKVLSIVIGAECTKVCEVSYKKNYKNKGIKVYRSISFPTPQNMIDDGLIRDMNGFGEELRNRLKAAKFKSDKVIFSVSSSKIANREVILPPVKDKKIMDIIRTGATDYFPIDMKEYILSYLILERKTSLRKERAHQRKLKLEEKKHQKKLDKELRKAKKRKSKTEIIAESMEEMEALALTSENSDHNVSGEAKKNQYKKHIRLSVFAVPAALVKNYYKFAKLMHLDIISLDYSGNSSYQMIKRQVNRGTNVFIQLNEQDTLISILRDDVLILQRNIGYGISMLTDAVVDQPYYRVNNSEEAWQLLREKNLLTKEEKVEIQFDSYWTEGEAAAASEYIRALGAGSMTEEEQMIKARQSIRESLHFLSNSIARMLDYYKSNNKGVEFNTVYLTGTGIQVKGIEQFFTEEIGLPHKRKEKLSSVSSIKKASAFRMNPSEFISCVGAVIKPIDFVPLEFTLKKQKRSAVLGTVIFALTCLVGAAGLVYIAHNDYQLASQELNRVRRQYEAMPQISGVYTEYETVQNELISLQELEAKIKSNNDRIIEVIGEFEKKLPSNSVIHSIQFSESGVTMNVTVADTQSGHHAIIAKVLLQLKSIDYFSNVDISGISVTNTDGISKVNFSIYCMY